MPQFCATWVSLFIDVVCAIYGSDCYYTEYNSFLLVRVVLVHLSYVYKYTVMMIIFNSYVLYIIIIIIIITSFYIHIIIY